MTRQSTGENGAWKMARVIVSLDESDEEEEKEHHA